VPIFILLTPGKTDRKRKWIAFKAAFTSLIILSLFVIFGHYILTYFGISTPAFEIAGGLILIKLAYDLLWARLPEIKCTPREEEEGLLKKDISLIPLAMPLLSGPGAIATVFILSKTADRPWMTMVLLGSVFLNCFLIFLILAHASAIARILKETGAALLTRILGLILMAVGVQFILSGLSGFLGLVSEETSFSDSGFQKI
jgi:MarC family membrane protein